MHTHEHKLQASLLADLLGRAESLGLSVKARERLRYFLFAAEHGGDLVLTCAHFGLAHSTLHRWIERFDPARPETLEDRSRRPHRTREAETPEQVVAWIRHYRTLYPTMGKEAIRKILLEQHGITVSASTVGRVIARHGFFFADTPAHRKKRRKEDLTISLTAITVVPGDAPVPTPDQLPFHFE